VILSSIDRGSRMKVGRVTRLRSAPGRSCEMICMSTFEELQVSYIPSIGFRVHIMLTALCKHVLLPCSESMTVSSSRVTSSPLVSSVDDRTLPAKGVNLMSALSCISFIKTTGSEHDVLVSECRRWPCPKTIVCAAQNGRRRGDLESPKQGEREKYTADYQLRLVTGA
jgi:hypothetical protein